jgi:hypothetical protein
MKTVAEVIGVSRSNLAERRQGHPQKRIGRPPLPDEELVAQIHTRSFARDIGLEPRTTPIESPQSNGMAEAFVRTIKRDYVRVSPRPNAESVMRQLRSWITHYNEVHPHKALRYRSPREFIVDEHDDCRSCSPPIDYRRKASSARDKQARQQVPSKAVQAWGRSVRCLAFQRAG